LAAARTREDHQSLAYPHRIGGSHRMPMQPNTALPDLSLDKGWSLTRTGESHSLTVDFPNDVHSVLLAHGVIGDPYWRDRETGLDWIHESEWLAERSFDISELKNGR